MEFYNHTNASDNTDAFLFLYEILDLMNKFTPQVNFILTIK